MGGNVLSLGVEVRQASVCLTLGHLLLRPGVLQSCHSGTAARPPRTPGSALGPVTVPSTLWLCPLWAVPKSGPTVAPRPGSCPPRYPGPCLPRSFCRWGPKPETGPQHALAPSRGKPCLLSTTLGEGAAWQSPALMGAGRQYYCPATSLTEVTPEQHAGKGRKGKVRSATRQRVSARASGGSPCWWLQMLTPRRYPRPLTGSTLGDQAQHQSRFQKLPGGIGG